MADGTAQPPAVPAAAESDRAVGILDFAVVNVAPPGGPCIYRSDKPSLGRIQLTITNSSSASVKLRRESSIALDLANVLYEDAQVEIVEQEDWECVQEEGVVTLKPKSALSLGSHKKTKVELTGVLADPKGDAATRQVPIAYAKVEGLKDGDQDETVFIHAEPTLSTKLPIKCSFAARTSYGGLHDDGHVILTTPPGEGPALKNKLVLVLENASLDEPIPMRDWRPRFIVSFRTGNDPKAPGTLCTADDLGGGQGSATVTQTQGEEGRAWQHDRDSQGRDVSFVLQPPEDGGDLFGESGPLVFTFSDIVTRFAPGNTVMYVHHAGVPGFDDGYAAVSFQKMAAIELTLTGKGDKFKTADGKILATIPIDGKLDVTPVDGKRVAVKPMAVVAPVDWGEVGISWVCNNVPQRCRLLAEDPAGTGFVEIFNSTSETVEGQTLFTPAKKLSRPIRFKFLAEGRPTAEQHFQLRFRPVVTSFKAHSSDIAGGDQLTLTWDCSGGVSCSLSGPDVDRTGLDLTGSIVLPTPDIAEQKTYTYTLVCKGGEGVEDSVPSECKVLVKVVTIDTFEAEIKHHDDGYQIYDIRVTWKTTLAEKVRLTGSRRLPKPNDPNAFLFFQEREPTGEYRDAIWLTPTPPFVDDFPEIGSWTLSALRGGTVRGKPRTIEFDTRIKVAPLTTFTVNGQPVRFTHILPWGPVTFKWKLDVATKNCRLLCDGQPVALGPTDLEQGQVTHTPPPDKTNVFYTFEADTTPPVRCAFVLRLTPAIARFEVLADDIVLGDVVHLNWECGGGCASLFIEEKSWNGDYQPVELSSGRYPGHGGVPGIDSTTFPVSQALWRSRSEQDRPVAYRFVFFCGTTGIDSTQGLEYRLRNGASDPLVRVIELPARRPTEVRAARVKMVEGIQDGPATVDRDLAQLSWTANDPAADSVWLIFHTEVGTSAEGEPVGAGFSKTMQVSASGQAWVDLRSEQGLAPYYRGYTIRVIRGPLVRDQFLRWDDMSPPLSDAQARWGSINKLDCVILTTPDGWVAEVSWSAEIFGRSDNAAVHLITTKISDGDGAARPGSNPDDPNASGDDYQRQQREQERERRAEHDRQERERGGQPGALDGESHDVPAVGSMRIPLGIPGEVGKADDRIPGSGFASAFPRYNGCTLLAINGGVIVTRYLSFEPYLQAQKLLLLDPSNVAGISSKPDA